ncbi:MAG: hypothetical protein QME51_08795, partial [Planctomycetota bacterium]|nr:hypothetical protein [Planctomycetota bacterium]MDI6788454.1 hypothetical protein [Planctomycetota bacterium]
MFVKKSKPELYEVLKIHRAKLGKLLPKDKEEHLDSESGYYGGQPGQMTTPYPKLKMPFPFYPKQKETAVTFQKSKSVPEAPRPDVYRGRGRPASGGQVRPYIEKERLPSQYKKMVIVGVVIILLVIVVYVILSQIKPVTPTTTTVTDITRPTAPVASIRFWSIKLVHYRNDAEGGRLVQKRLLFLNNKGISGVFTNNEIIDGTPHIVIYKGEYQSLEDANKEIPRLKQLQHYEFKNIEAVKHPKK